VIVGVVFALASAVCYGVAAVLQARAARSTAHGHGVDVRFLVRLVRQLPFLGGLAMDVVGFAAQFAALRTLPVFVVQAAQASSLAITAVLAVPLLGAGLSRWQWLAVVAVCAGLAMLAGSGAAEAGGTGGAGIRLLLFALIAVLGVTGLVAARRKGRARDSILGLVAGLGFGVVALASRALETPLRPAHLVRDAAAYALAAAAAVAFLFYATALQKGHVTSVGAAVILGETLLPAVVGVLAFGDHARRGLWVVAVAAFCLVVVGALGLSRAGDPTVADP